MILMDKYSEEQGFIINEVSKLLDDGEQGRFEKYIIDDGICYALSLEWIRLISEGEISNAIHINSPDAIKENVYYYKQIAGNFLHYIVNVETKKSVKTAASNLGLLDKLTIYISASEGTRKLSGLTEINLWYVNAISNGKLRAPITFIYDNEEKIQDAFCKKYDSDPGLYLIGTDDHQMAMASAEMDGETVFLFYDPNFGVYKINSIDEVIAHISTEYNDSISFDICRVEKVQD